MSSPLDPPANPPRPPSPVGATTPFASNPLGAPPPGYQAYQPTPMTGAERAGFGARLGGWLLDSVIYGAIAAAFAIPGIVLLVTAFSDCVTIDDELVCPNGSVDTGAIVLGGLLIAAAMLLVFGFYVRQLGTSGQTWGRKVAGVKVLDEMTGGPIGIGKALGRTLFAGFFSAQFFYIGYLWVLWDGKKQTWHDKVVSSIVVRV